MNELVEIINSEAVTNSLLIAESFGKQHSKVIRSIEGFTEAKNGLSKMFKKTTYKDASGRNNPMYRINRDGFSLLVMSFTGKKALEWKLMYIDAFNKMEKALMERNTELWITARKEGKLTRKAETSVIQNLIEYAKEQGSEHSEKLYMVYSKLANVMAGVTDRDSATFKQLSELSFIENIILNQIKIGMEREQHYKEIYRDCKRQIELFKDIAYLETA